MLKILIPPRDASVLDPVVLARTPGHDHMAPAIKCFQIRGGNREEQKRI
jgi:hypothetical protein